MKVLITGAHFTPAMAVIAQLKKQKDIEIVYAGRSTTMEGDDTLSVESQTLPRKGIKFIPITTGRLQREFSLYTIPSLLKIPIGLIQSFWIIISEKPDVILSFGGYVGVPIVIAGWLFSIPILIHEQTLVSGLANKISSFFADKIAISFKSGNFFNSHKTILTGNPIREDVLNPKGKLSLEFINIFETARREKLPILLIMGGNQGSHIINLTVEQCLSKLKKISCIIHVTGDSKFGDFERLISLQDEKYIVKKWIGEEYGAILSKIDLVVCRAGVNTLTEAAYAGKPSLVIPLPNIFQDEQTKNARYFENLNLIRILPQSKLSSDTLVKNIKNCLNDLPVGRQGLNNMNIRAKKANNFIISDAAKRLTLETIILARVKSV